MQGVEQISCCQGLGVGDMSAEVLTLGAFGGGVGHGSVQYLNCGCGYRTLGIYQNSKKRYTKKSEFYYMQIDWWIFICQFLLLTARNPFVSFPSWNILYSVASPLQPFLGTLLLPHSLPIKKEKHSKKDKTEFPNENFKHTLWTEALFVAETKWVLRIQNFKYLAYILTLIFQISLD